VRALKSQPNSLLRGSAGIPYLSGISAIRYKGLLYCTVRVYHRAACIDLKGIHPALNTKERVAYDDISSDSRFSSEAHQSPYKSVVCLPIFGNRGQTFGALYLASKYAFSKNTITLLTLLCQQANISVANALLFRSVQAGTKENLRMISAQKEALEDARQSRENALKATRVIYVFSFQDNSVLFLHVFSRSKVTFWLRCPTSFGHLSGNSNRTLHIMNLFFL
jgi:transcriptional regulator with GAF, ATPase, and Fis domain